ncbi:MAG: hypothetical protein IJR58_00540, partial [Lachnospiraceae bacterium]|nr:hypothetical protein [Lachnospiraceae bacterium]
MFNLLLYVIIKVQQVRQQQGRSVFSSVLFSVMAANMITCLQVFLTYVNLPVPLTVICALQALAFMANTMVCYYFSYYMQRYFNRSTEDEKPMPLFNRCMVVAQGVILALWLLFAIPYILREDVLIRQDGILFFVTGFVMELYHLIYALYLFLLRRESSDSRSRLIVIFSFLLTISSIVVQAFIGETPMINYLGGTFALFVFYFNAETPDFIKLSRTMDELMVERQRAEAANVAKTEFLANMSHEMRTPLNAVLGMNEMILRQSKDAEITEYAGGIERAGQSLLSVINDVIDFSRIESGKMQINLAPYMLSAVIGD